MSVEQRFLSRNEAARYCGVCVRTIDRLASQGEVPVLRIGRKPLFDRADLDRYCDALKTVA